MNGLSLQQNITQQSTVLQATSIINPHVDLDALCHEIRTRACRGEFDDQAFVSQDMMDKLKILGVFRALVPKRFGGTGGTPYQFCELIEKLSMADGSVGWVASFGMSPAYLGCLPEATLLELYKNSPDIVFAGGIFPSQSAEITPHGLRVRGRWKFASGCLGADFVGVGISPQQDHTAQGLPRMAVMPAKQAKIEMTWDTVGLKGTGSHDLVIEDVVVPDTWTFVRGEASKRPETFFKYPALSLATQVLTVVGIGVAAAALEEFRLLAPNKASITGGSEIGLRPVTQYEFAQANAEFQAARAWFYQSIQQVWQSVSGGDQATTAQMSSMRLSCTHATRVAAQVCRKMQMLAGMTAIYNHNPFSRFVNDCNVITQHAFMGDSTLQNAAAVSFGLQPTTGYL